MLRRLAIIQLPYQGQSALRRSLLLNPGADTETDPLTSDIRATLPPDYRDVVWVATEHDQFKGITEVLVTLPSFPLVPYGIRPPVLLYLKPPQEDDIPNDEPSVVMTRDKRGVVCVLAAQDENGPMPLSGGYRELCDHFINEFQQMNPDVANVIAFGVRLRVAPLGQLGALRGERFGSLLAQFGFHSPVMVPDDQEYALALYLSGRDIWQVSHNEAAASAQRLSAEGEQRE